MFSISTKHLSAAISGITCLEYFVINALTGEAFFEVVLLEKNIKLKVM